MMRFLCLVAALGLVACDPDTPSPTTPDPMEESPQPPVADPPDDPDPPADPGPSDPPADPPMDPPADPPADPPTTPPPSPTDDMPTPTPVAPTVDPGAEVDLAPPVEPPVPQMRARRRMNLDQLDAAFRRTSAGIGWTETRGNNEVNLFVELSATLGKPDFVQITTEDLDPSALFNKFLGDASRSICAKMVSRDENTPGPGLLIPARNGDSDAHLRALVLRFHNRDLGPESADLAQWRFLVDSLEFLDRPTAERWGAVCIALFTHPDFYSF